MSENPGPYMYVLSQWQLDDLRHEWLISDEGDAAVTAAAAAYHETECAYRVERDFTRAILDRVRTLADGLPDAPRVRLIHAALHPEKDPDASLQWVLDCTLGETETGR